MAPLLPSSCILLVSLVIPSQYCTVWETQKVKAPDASYNDQFGAAVALRDHWMVIGAPEDEEPEFGDGTAYFFALDDAGTPMQPADDYWVFRQKLLNWTATGHAQRFGSAVEFGTDMLFVGAPNDHQGPGSATGAVFSFFIRTQLTPEDPTDDACIPVQRITSNPMSNGSGFGFAMAFSGEHLAVGAPGGFYPPESAGQVFVFHRDDAGTVDRPTDDQWVQQVRILNPDGVGQPGFGASVWMNDSWLMVGAPGTCAGESCPGAVYVFARDISGTPSQPTDDQWNLHSKLMPTNSNCDEYFGQSIALQGSTMAIGAGYAVAALCGDDRSPCDNNDDCTVGVCDPLGNPCHEYVECAPLNDACVQPPDSGPCDGPCSMYSFNACTGQCEVFGYGCCGGNRNNFESQSQCELACLGTQHACLLPVDPGAGNEQLSRYYYNACARQCQPFTYGGTEGNANNFLTLEDCQNSCPPPDPPPASCVGGVTCGVATGAVYVYGFSAGAWHPEARLHPTFGRYGGSFGKAVALHDHQILVGAHFGDQTAIDSNAVASSGIVYMYARTGQGPWLQRRILSPSDPSQHKFFGESIATDDLRVVVGARLDSQIDFRTGAVYHFPINNAACSPASIPAISTSGLILLLCTFLILGVLILSRRHRCMTASAA